MKICQRISRGRQMINRKNTLDKLGNRVEKSQMVNQLFKGQPTKIEVIEMGDTIFCDACNEDYTNNDLATGGFIFGSKAYCPRCAEKRLPSIKSYGEEHYIKAYCPKGMSFKDFILKIRDGNNQIKIITSKKE